MLIEPHTLLEKYVTYPPKSKLNFDEIFVINLERRPEQRRRMEWALHQFGIDFRLFSAIDGRYICFLEYS